MAPHQRLKSSWDGKCIACGIGKPRLNKTLCDRCLREYKARRKKRKKYEGICASWGYAEWQDLNQRLIEYLTYLDTTDDSSKAC